MSRDTPTSRAADRVEERTEFVMELPSDLRVIEAAVSYLTRRLQSYAYDGSRLNLNFRVGVTEALANAVLYGNEGDPRRSVRVEVSLDPHQVVLRVTDEGSGFDPDRVPDPTIPPNIDRPGGRGLFLLRELMDEVEYNDSGNAVRIVLMREPPPQRHSAGR